jgi:hypothetical protein
MKGNNNVSAVDFIKAWQRSSSTREVCARLNLPYSTRSSCRFRSRAKSYRKRGVPLKFFPKQLIQAKDWSALRELAQEELDRNEGGE